MKKTLDRYEVNPEEEKLRREGTHFPDRQTC